MLSSIPSQWMVYGSTIFLVFMGVGAMVMRAKSAKKPATPKKIIIPPIAMTTGALMFIFPYFHVGWIHIFYVVVTGILCSFILVKTSHFEIDGNDIYLKPSKAFIVLLAGLLVIRTAAKVYLSGTIDFGELAGMFFILAYSMIAPWRLMMLRKYFKLRKQVDEKLVGNT